MTGSSGEPLADGRVSLKDVPQMRAAGVTDVGRVRQENQDAYLLMPELGLIAVADGIGGGPAGALAARITVDCLPGYIDRELSQVRTDDPDVKLSETREALRRAVTTLSQEIGHRTWPDQGIKGMGATLVVVLFRGGSAHIASLGDSRAYLLRQNNLMQLTADHNVAALLLRLGEIRAEEAPTHPGRNRLTQYVGMDGEAEPDIQTLPLAPGDRFLVCSDGLTGMVSDAAIQDIVVRGGDPDRMVHELVDAAKTAGGRDNITVVIADVAPFAT